MLAAMTTPDPGAFFREMLGEWEKMANQLGGQMLKSDEWARAMHGAQGAALSAQGANREMMDRALAAANMPSRAEVEDLSLRLARIEASIARIEQHLAGTPPRAHRPRPARTRKPPVAS